MDIMTWSNGAPSTSRGTPARSLNSTFVVYPQRPAFVCYTVRIDAAAAGDSGRVVLLSDAAAPPTTILATAGGAAVAGAGGADRMMVPRTWYQDAAAANQTAVVLAAGGGSATATEWRATRAGWITGMAVQASTPVTAGYLQIKGTKNGGNWGGAGEPSISLLPSGPTQGDQQTWAADNINFPVAAGDLIGATITTAAGLLPITANVEAWFEYTELGAGGGGGASVEGVVCGIVYPGHNVRLATQILTGAPTFTLIGAMEVSF